MVRENQRNNESTENSNSDKSDGLWKNLAIALISIVITGVTAFIGLRVNTPSTDEMQKYVTQNSITSEQVREILDKAAPREQELWKNNLAGIEKLVSGQQEQVNSLRKEVDDAKLRQVRMDAKLDVILEELRSQRNVSK
jgi:hypothetical protein